MQKTKHIKSKILRSGISKDKARLDLKLDSNTEDSKKSLYWSLCRRRERKEKKTTQEERWPAAKWGSQSIDKRYRSVLSIFFASVFSRVSLGLSCLCLVAEWNELAITLVNWTNTSPREQTRPIQRCQGAG